MGFDWENILDASGAGLADAYEEAASRGIYEYFVPSRMDVEDEERVMPD